MFHETRRIACVVYLMLLLGTFLAGILRGPFLLVLFLLIAQGFAAAWYMVSYIPYGTFGMCDVTFSYDLYVLLFTIPYVRLMIVFSIPHLYFRPNIHNQYILVRKMIYPSALLLLSHFSLPLPSFPYPASLVKTCVGTVMRSNISRLVCG